VQPNYLPWSPQTDSGSWATGGGISPLDSYVKGHSRSFTQVEKRQSQPVAQFQGSLPAYSASPLNDFGRQTNYSPLDPEGDEAGYSAGCSSSDFDDDSNEDISNNDMTLKSPPAQARVHTFRRSLFLVPSFNPEHITKPVPFTPHASWYQGQLLSGTPRTRTASGPRLDSRHHALLTDVLSKSPQTALGRQRHPSSGTAPAQAVCAYPYVNGNT